MPKAKGKIALMGSGELTATMVEVHKELLTGFTVPPRAVFLDTPAGFQLNVDLLSKRAVEYFRSHVQYPLTVASFKSIDTTPVYEATKAFQILESSDYVLIGPGSPTYALRQWKRSPVPTILKRRIEAGACLVAASAAALTVGRYTLPVYEIYKVGDELHWVEGMDVLGYFGFELVVIPHWNNAEGGTHDTRFCYMGEPRFAKLESLLPSGVSILGLDEHTACIIDLEKGNMSVKGIGSVIVRKEGVEVRLGKGDTCSLDILRGQDVVASCQRLIEVKSQQIPERAAGDHSFWERVHELRIAFQQGVEHHIPGKATHALLELDALIWKLQGEESEEFITQAREVERDMMVLLGGELASPSGITAFLDPIVEELIELRTQFRRRKQWSEADAIRKCLELLTVMIEDTQDGTRWRWKSR